VTPSTYRRSTNNCIYLSIYLYQCRGGWAAEDLFKQVMAKNLSLKAKTKDIPP